MPNSAALKMVIHFKDGIALTACYQLHQSMPCHQKFIVEIHTVIVRFRPDQFMQLIIAEQSVF